MMSGETLERYVRLSGCLVGQGRVLAADSIHEYGDSNAVFVPRICFECGPWTVSTCCGWTA